MTRGDDGRQRLTGQLLALSRSLPVLIERVRAHNEARAPGDAPSAATPPLIDAQREGERLAAFAAYLDHYGAVEGGTFGPLDVRTVIEQAVALASGEIAPKARVTASYLPAPLVKASARQLGQVVISLLINAAQAIPAGARDAHHVGVELDTNDAGWARVAIADTGAGIPADVLPHIFEPLFSTKRGAGMGIGLAIVREIVDAIGGRISVESEPGLGTLVVLVLPPAP